MGSLNLSERYPALLNLLLGVIVLYFLALSVSDIFKLHYTSEILTSTAEVGHNRVTPAPSILPRQTYQVIVQRDIFDPTPTEAAPVADEHLDATLIGTSQVTDGKPYAIIETSGDQGVYRVGEMVPGAGKLLGVGKSRVIILHDGHRVALELPHDNLTPAPPIGSRSPQSRHLRRDIHSAPLGGGVHPAGPNRYVLDRSLVNSDLKNMAPLFTQIRATPQIQNGVADGYILTEIQPNSIFQQIGLQDGDVLEAVNGQTVGDPAKAFTLLQSLQNQSQITLNVMRNGITQQVHYQIR